MSADDYVKAVIAQGGLCFLCGEPGALMVDHDHTSGQIRKLLCRDCNTGLGRFKDNPRLLRKATVYLESFKES